MGKLPSRFCDVTPDFYTVITREDAEASPPDDREEIRKFFDGVTLKRNPYHDELGRFTFAHNAASTNPSAAAGIDSEPHTPPPPGNFYAPDPTHDPNGDGVADYARVGVPAMSVPPPPERIPRLPNLTKHERQAEENFARRFEADPNGMASTYREGVVAHAAQKGGPPVFETDGAKLLSPDWNDADPAKQAEKRGHFNTALHQTANAITKRAFVQHLDTLSPGDEIMVTAGGCAAGKGYVLKKSKEGAEMMSRAKVVWDSAGDQNATEHPWILAEAQARGLKVNYVYVHADAKDAWDQGKSSVVNRAMNPANGRMVDAAVYADSYALGARNHAAFHEQHKNTAGVNFLYVTNSKEGDFSPLSSMPKDAFIDREELYRHATQAVEARQDIPPHVKRGALAGKRIWKPRSV